MTIGIIGLGLIGGSFAKALSGRTSHTLKGRDKDPEVTAQALALGILREELAPGGEGECEIVLIAVPPEATLKILRETAPRMRAGGVVVDCCGVKRGICALGDRLAHQHGFYFIGGHPMAGREYGGLESSKPDLFDGASMLLVPGGQTDVGVVDIVEGMLAEIGFAVVLQTTAETHDRVIALTSQLAHVVSNAYVKSPQALEHRGFSAGSFADMTRVARLDEELWTQLFLANSDFLVDEIDVLMDSLETYREALAEKDAPRLKLLLRAGREIKERL